MIGLTDLLLSSPAPHFKIRNSQITKSDAIKITVSKCLFSEIIVKALVSETNEAHKRNV
jgi:hypothetical protein